jgi:uncharacterized membrane protein YhaH (DUF805 family)
MVGWRAAAVYVVAAVALTFPLAFRLTSSLGALQREGDPYLNLWIIGWGLHAWTTDPLSVIRGDVFDANIFYPAEGTLAYSDHFLLQSLALAPVYAITGNAALCYNLLLIGSIALSGLAMHAFARTVTGSTTGAYLAGLTWACWPYRTAHFLHIQVQALYFLPLALLWLHRVMAGRRWRDALMLAVWAALQFVSSGYYGLLTALALVVASVVLAVTTGQWRSRRLWSRLAVAAAIALALSVPVMIPYLRTAQTESFGRMLAEASRRSAAVQSYTQVPPVNLLYGRTGWLDPRPPRLGQPDRTPVEHQMFPGLVLVALALLGLARGIGSDARPAVCTAAAIAAIGLVLSFGPEGWRWLYATLHDNIVGVQATRAPARFAVLATSGLALLAAFGMRSLAHRPKLTALLTGLLCLEYANAPLPLAPAPPARTAVGQWLATQPPAGAVLHLPIGVGTDNTLYMVQSLEHWRPIVNGYSGQRPTFFMSLVESLADLPSPTAFAMLREIDVRLVVSPSPVGGAGHPRSPLVERARLNEGVIYELRWTPEAIAALDERTAPPPPAAGSPPFTAGEVIVYDVYWDGGPLDIPAGTATMVVVNGHPGASRWEFETRAESADWMATFFQARDRFTTITDGELLPLAHTREIREGRRQVERRYVYDRAANLVHTQQMALPLGAPTSRDAFSALYYVRTLPLAPGTIVTVPLHEAGASLLLQVSVADTETIEQRGRSIRALRLEPRVMRRLERQRPVSITLWLSTDVHRIPLRALVDAGFGRIRLELKEHRR